MLFNKNEEELAQNEEILLQQYVHWWIFVFPGVLLIFGLYLWIKAITNGSFSLYSLIIFDQPTALTGSMKYYIQLYLYQGSELVREHLPNAVFEFLSTTRIHPRKWISQIVMIYALYRLVRATLTFITTKITVTNRRILVETGFFRPQVVEFPKMHVDAFHIKKGFLSRFLNVGAIIIQASGGLTARIPAVKLPQLLTTTVVENDSL